MRVMTGTVVDGKIQLETALEDGTPVAILIADEAGFQLSDEEEEELATALADIRGGDFVDGRELLRELKTR